MILKNYVQYCNSKGLKLKHKSDLCWACLVGFENTFLSMLNGHCLLTELTSKRVPNRTPWGSNEQKSFDKLKEVLCAAADQPLSIINWDKPFNIHTDASDCMVAGILSQTGEDGNECPTAFYSKKLSDT